MTGFLARYAEWLWLLGGVSAALMLISVMLAPVVLVRLPEDYFLPSRQLRRASARSSSARWLVTILRNGLGLGVVAVGVALLILPGQGVLTIVAGLFLMQFRAKRRLLRRLVARERVQRSLNWLRVRAGRRPFRFSE